MINYLKDCKKTTLIGQLPEIINENNKAIDAEFGWIFETSTNRLTKSLCAPTGSVKAHFGEFVNLSCDYMTIKNVDSLKNSIQTTVTAIMADALDPSTKAVCDHELMSNRFINRDLEDSGLMHDADAIVYAKNEDQYVVTVKQAIDNLSDKVKAIDTQVLDDVADLSTHIKNVDSSIITINSSIAIINSSISQLTYKGMPYYVIDRYDYENHIKANTYYVYVGEFNNNIVFVLDESDDKKHLNEYIVRFTYFHRGTNVDFQSSMWPDIIWEYENEPQYDEGFTYEIKIIDGYGSYKKYKLR